MSLETTVEEARRQLEICNACRYCEGYCSVFPATFRKRAFTSGDVTQLANLCHNCRGCYYACQYIEPHEFALNLPRALAEVRNESWQRFAWPAGLAERFQRSGAAIALASVAAFIFLVLLTLLVRPTAGAGFYRYLSHGWMIAIFIPALLLPLATVAVSLRRYWRAVDGQPVRLAHLRWALGDAARLKNLSGGAAEGCNFEAGDRFTNGRRHAHQAMLWGFVLCLASTSLATLMHYALGLEAPYRWYALPKLLGVPGGLLMVVGGCGLIWLKFRADRQLGAPAVWGAELAFSVLVTTTALTGLILYAATGTAAVPWLLDLHLGSILALFLLMPFTKMTHISFRLAALTREAQLRG